MFFVFNLRSFSQAGRRGFEPRLPLHKINLFVTYATAGARSASVTAVGVAGPPSRGAGKIEPFPRLIKDRKEILASPAPDRENRPR
jgi:hypothetical protein